MALTSHERRRRRAQRALIEREDGPGHGSASFIEAIGVLTPPCPQRACAYTVTEVHRDGRIPDTLRTDVPRH